MKKMQCLTVHNQKEAPYFFMILVPLDSQSLQLSENVEKVFPIFFSLILKN